MAFAVGVAQKGSLGSTAATSVVLTAPAGVGGGAIADDSLIVAIIGQDIVANGDPGAPTITGFTQVTSHYTPANFRGSLRLTTLIKKASGESGDYTASWASASLGSWAIFCITGQDTTTPVDAAGTNNYTSDTTTEDSPSVSPTGADDLLLCAYADSGGGNPTVSITGLTVIFDTDGDSPGGSNADQVSIAAGYIVLSASGATAQYTRTMSFSNIAETAAIAIMAAGGGGGGAIDDIATRSGSIFVV